ncbi:MAG: NAD(+) synthase, partial [Bacteroidota bacterium]
MVVSVGLPVFVHNKLYNAACLIVNGVIQGFVAKKFLAGNGIHYEPRWFTPWTIDGYDKITLSGQQYPIGDIYFDVGGIKIGFEICEDAWVANRPGRELHLYGIDLILNPSASHFAFSKLEVRKRFVLEGSRAFGVTYVYANLLGNEAGRAIYDGGGMIASSGSLLAIGKRLSFRDYHVTTATVDISLSRLAQVQMHTLEVPGDYGHCMQTAFDYPPLLPQILSPKEASCENSVHIKEEEFSRAMVLGLFDYLRKSYSNGFVISLSGGADSSSLVCLSRLMIDLVIREIGIEGLHKKLAYIKDITQCTSADALAKRLITTAYQGTKNSGEVTLTAASKLAEAVSSDFHHLKIDKVVEEYIRIISESLGRALTWEEDDITLQNIQARGRAPSIWMFANIKNALLLSTSNRSEAAVGYATMDGDTSGGLSPIAGIDKDYLRHWLRWLEKEGVEGEYTIPALSYVNE